MTVFAVPPDTVPSGGNTYDRRLAEALTQLGRPVHRRELPGAWPRPGPEGTAALQHLLAAQPDGAAVLLDGLVACGVPQVLHPHAARLHLAVIVHLPLAEGAHDPAEAAELDTLERAALECARTVVATSGWAARHLARRHGLELPAVVVPGTDPAPAAAPGDGSRLLCVASLSRHKGHEVLLEALASAADLPWSCVCAGPDGGLSASLSGSGGSRASLLREQVRRLGIGGRVSFPGTLTPAALEDAYAGADLFVLPTHGETYGMVITEALARGLPVLTSRVGGVPEALGRDREGSLPGMLVPPGDPAALARELRRWLTDGRLRARLRRSALLRREDLTGWEEAARETAALLDREETR
ncbi:glycosyltransferase family 4 protein [Nocardiopsis algeriensis]|uniref:glycosyltransferase family 4 protein n=1 Tax=Nocardiopsis algeriensis TaxID=1478215 RepID=UPI003B432CA9